MSITITCDRCGSEDGALDDSTWRTLCVGLEYLPNAREFGTCDTLFELVLCYECVELLHTPNAGIRPLKAAILAAIR